MKTASNNRLLLVAAFFALASCWAVASGSKSGSLKSTEPAPTFSHGTESRLNFSFLDGDATAHLALDQFAMLQISCGSSAIEIDLRTGAVKLPKDVPLEAAAVRFWHGVAAAFPEARKQIIEGAKKK